MLEYNSIRINADLHKSEYFGWELKPARLFINKEATYHALSVTVLSAHSQVQSESVRIDNVNVTGFRTSQRVDTPVKRFVSTYLDGDTGVLAVNGNYKKKCIIEKCIEYDIYIISISIKLTVVAGSSLVAIGIGAGQIVNGWIFSGVKDNRQGMIDSSCWCSFWNKIIKFIVISTELTAARFLLSHWFSKYCPVGSPWSINGRSAFRYVDGPSGSVLWSRW